MLDRLLKLRWPVTDVLSDSQVTKPSDRYLDLKSEQGKLAEELVEVLENFSTATTFLSYEENVSISAVFPILHSILDQLEPDVSDSGIIKQFKYIVSSEISERFELKSLHAAHPMLLTAIIDPQFKNLTLGRYTETEQEALKKVIIELLEMYKEYEEHEPASHEPSPSVVKRPKRLTALDKLLGEEAVVAEPSLSSELEKYLAEPPPPRRDNPLVWWKLNAGCFNVVSFVARRLLCIPATTTSSERVFSTAGLTVTKLRSL
ncbi:zinc finger BED domain-containing protein 4-like [Limulus polyphemus]|uniref:Zinc finger BED domain-containing protein 4-like n=1 Tax=Limulus polyphemus TaxID=6850 RepID=A0ABM1S533_LIMPO|nr:zinc finger BED domain-containing protein 4-like [Limulus polyphemus]